MTDLYKMKKINRELKKPVSFMCIDRTPTVEPQYRRLLRVASDGKIVVVARNLLHAPTVPSTEDISASKSIKSDVFQAKPLNHQYFQHQPNLQPSKKSKCISNETSLSNDTTQAHKITDSILLQEISQRKSSRAKSETEFKNLGKSVSKRAEKYIQCNMQEALPDSQEKKTTRGIKRSATEQIARNSQQSRLKSVDDLVGNKFRTIKRTTTEKVINKPQETVLKNVDDLADEQPTSNERSSTKRPDKKSPHQHTQSEEVCNSIWRLLTEGMATNSQQTTLKSFDTLSEEVSKIIRKSIAARAAKQSQRNIINISDGIQIEVRGWQIDEGLEVCKADNLKIHNSDGINGVYIQLLREIQKLSDCTGNSRQTFPPTMLKEPLKFDKFNYTEWLIILGLLILLWISFLLYVLPDNAGNIQNTFIGFLKSHMPKRNEN